MDAAAILDGLNEEQRRAAEAVRGPVCILAGAGSGKTTTITRRIANQVASGAFAADQILAVTFTDKAATEMRNRLEALGAEGVRARTFHSAALAQLHWFRGSAPGRILSSKTLMLHQLAKRLPRPYRFRPAGDLATEIERAKNSRLTPETYRAQLGTHEPPIPDDLMARVFRDYEAWKRERRLVDFEDLLELAIRMLEEDAEALAAVRARYHAFTVDEYQDVNLLQQTLLELWLGERDDLCAVGDDYQSIYAFTGATPTYLLQMPQRFPHATVVRLEANYRSSPQVLARANVLVPRLGGAQKTLRATRTDGPEPELRGFEDALAERAWILERVQALHAAGVPYEEIAVLVRLNARSPEFELLFGDAGIPFQGAALLAREAAKQVLKALRGSHSTAVAAKVKNVAAEQGLLVGELPDNLGEREVTRQMDLRQLVRLAQEFDDGVRDVPGFVDWLRDRFDHGKQGGVHLLTLHRAKGLEFDAVFLPRVDEKELPCAAALRSGGSEIAEERRLLYVGMTRARRHLAVTWTKKPSRFLAELGVETVSVRPRRRAVAEEELPPAVAALRKWRLERARADEVPAYVVFHNSTLELIAERAPKTLAELGSVPGVGPTKLERYGEDVLATLADAA